MSEFSDQKGYLLGVDTGTSKTHALVSDLEGNVLGFGKSGPGNYEAVGETGLCIAIEKAIETALQRAKIKRNEIAGMGFGLAGYDWPSERAIMARSIDSLGISSPYKFVNDAVIGLVAGTSEGWGVAVDAGTGNNVRGLDQMGRIGRITGNSVRFGEIGGSGELVWKAMVAATYAWTQRGPKTQITQLFMDYADVSTEEKLIEGLAMEQIHLPAILAKNIIHLALTGDRVACEVVEQTAQELALNVNAVIRQLKFQDRKFEIVLIGSLFKAGEIYLRPFTEEILKFAPHAKFIQLNIPPVIGSVLLAAEIIGKSTNSIRPALIKTIAKYLRFEGSE